MGKSKGTCGQEHQQIVQSGHVLILGLGLVHCFQVPSRLSLVPCICANLSSILQCLMWMGQAGVEKWAVKKVMPLILV